MLLCSMTVIRRTMVYISIGHLGRDVSNGEFNKTWRSLHISWSLRHHRSSPHCHLSIAPCWSERDASSICSESGSHSSHLRHTAGQFRTNVFRDGYCQAHKPSCEAWNDRCRVRRGRRRGSHQRGRGETSANEYGHTRFHMQAGMRLVSKDKGTVISAEDVASSKFVQSASSSFADNVARSVEKALGPKTEE